MLNDLLSIERGLTAYGIDIGGRHPDVKDMAKGWAFRVRLAKAGRVASVEIVPEAGNGAVWTLRDGQHNGFPGLKTGFPVKLPNGKTEVYGLLRLDSDARQQHEQAWKAASDANAKRRELSRVLDLGLFDHERAAKWPNAGHRKRIGERLEALRPLADDPLTAAVPAAFERFLAAVNASPSFLEQLADALAERVRDRGDEWLDPVRAALIGSVPLAIDVEEMEFDRDASDIRQVDAVSATLSGSSFAEGDGAEPGTVCALSGKAAKLHAGNFPQPNLPGLGQTYIFSRNRDIPSLTRYGRTADASFGVGADLVRRLSGAITALTREDAKGKTWRLIPAETGDSPDLLVMSTADRSASLVEAVSDDEVGGEAALKELGSRVIDQSKGVLEHGYPEEDVTVLILRTVDPANRKAIYHRKTSSAELWKAAQRWQAATSNTPGWLAFPSPEKGKSEAVLRRPPYVAPLSITPLSRIQFANGGRRRVDVIGATSADAFGLLLGEGDVPHRARTLLRMLVRRHGSLLSGLAAARAKGINHLKDFDPKTDLRRDALRSTAWIGALLHHLGHEKEVYMSDVAFRLGQLLETADVVHIGYCADLRGGDVPPSLLGNSVLSIAGVNPERALAILASRLKPYLGWAKRAERLRTKVREMRTKEAKTEDQRKANRLSFAISDAFYSAPRLKELIDELRSAAKMKETDDCFKAELLLGYLAGLPRTERKLDPASTGHEHSPTDQREGSEP